MSLWKTLALMLYAQLLVNCQVESSSSRVLKKKPQQPVVNVVGNYCNFNASIPDLGPEFEEQQTRAITEEWYALNVVGKYDELPTEGTEPTPLDQHHLNILDLFQAEVKKRYSRELKRLPGMGTEHGIMGLGIENKKKKTWQVGVSFGKYNQISTWVNNNPGLPGISKKVLQDDAFTLGICHELGHLMGGHPFIKKGLSTEQQADYFATHKCLKRVFSHDKVLTGEVHTNKEITERFTSDVAGGYGSGNNCSDSLCRRIAVASHNFSMASNAPDSTCRYKTLFAGAHCTTGSTKYFPIPGIAANKCKGKKAAKACLKGSTGYPGKALKQKALIKSLKNRACPLKACSKYP